MRHKIRLILIAAAILLLVLLGLHGALWIPSFHFQPDKISAERRGHIAEAFQHAWDGYAEYCFGHDELRPVSHGCNDNFGGWGATAIDSLSMAIMLQKEEVVLQILDFIANDLDFTYVSDGSKIQVFEVTIRHLGGMLSAWDLLNGPHTHLARNSTLRYALFDKMATLGDILSCAFDTPSGIPRDWVDPVQRKTDSGSTNMLAGVGTMILEFARLSEITGNKTYVDLAARAEQYLLEPTTGEPYPGLLGSYVSVENGQLVNSQGSWGAFSDSYYEYLIKAYVYDSHKYTSYRDRWLLAADSTIAHIGTHPYGQPQWTLLGSWDGRSEASNRMESLSWFAGGNFILGGIVTKNVTLVDYGISIADAAGAVYNMSVTGLGGEFVSWSTDCDGWADDCKEGHSLSITDGRFRLRPEVVETWYYAYRATRNPKYRDWTWAAFEAVNRTCRTDAGFSALNDVNKSDGGGKTDVQESFVLAEMFKYMYLTHLEDNQVPYHVQDSGRTNKRNTWVFNTEAHPLRIAGPPI